MSVNSIINDIKNLKIQGATNVALKSLDAVLLFSKESKKKDVSKFCMNINNLKDILSNLRPTEPMQYNFLNFLTKDLANFNSVEDIKIKIEERVNYLKKLNQVNKKKIVLFGSNIIKDGMKVYTHCHSSTVVDLIVSANKNDISFEVNNTETRPLYQGRSTAKDLIKNKIRVNHYIDSEIPLAVSNSDIVLFGCDSINASYFFNKVGTKIAYEFAKKYDKPVYIVTESFKFDPRSLYGEETIIEKRNKSEVWDMKNKYLNIVNNAFDKVELTNVVIISEFGFYEYSAFINHLRKVHPFMFE